MTEAFTDTSQPAGGSDGPVSAPPPKPQSAELNPGPGFRVRYDIERPDPKVVEAFGHFETALVSDMMNRLYTMSAAIHSVTGTESRLLGPACTVKVFPGDNLMVHKSLDVARPGDVIVVDASSSELNGVIGDLVSTKARHRGVAGFIIDGLVRDISGIASLGDFPVFARGVTPIGPLHRGPGEINFPVSVGGIVVKPGDIVYGAIDGVVVIPREEAEELLARVSSKAEAEAEYEAAVAQGKFSNAWVDHILEEGGL
jgi:regulator of RNase E activity RraA